MPTHSQFIRKAKLLIGDNANGIDLSKLRFSFHLKQADLNTPHWISLRVYNLDRKTADAIKLHEYKRVVLEAGYQQGAYGLLFDGELIQARLGRETAVDTYMDILAAEGYSANQATINVSLAAGNTMLDAASAAAASMGRRLISYVTKPQPKLPRGQSFYGMARDILSNAAATMDATWFYVRGNIEIIPKEILKPTAATVLNANTGMIGWPEQTQDGIRVRCLLNPLLEVGSPLQIDNASILLAQTSADKDGKLAAYGTPQLDDDGLYRTYVIEHRGDTRGNDWSSDIICLSVDRTNFRLTGLVQKGQFA